MDIENAEFDSRPEEFEGSSFPDLTDSMTLCFCHFARMAIYVNTCFACGMSNRITGMQCGEAKSVLSFRVTVITHFTSTTYKSCPSRTFGSLFISIFSMVTPVLIHQPHPTTRLIIQPFPSSHVHKRVVRT